MLQSVIYPKMRVIYFGKTKEIESALRPKSGHRPDIVCRRQISSAQSADIVLTAGQDIVHQKCPGWIISQSLGSEKGLPFRKRYPAAPDDILPVVGRQAGWQVH